MGPPPHVPTLPEPPSSCQQGVDRAQQAPPTLCDPPQVPQLEDVFALLVVGGGVAVGAAQAGGGLSVVGGPMAGTLGILVDTQVAPPQHAVHALPGPGGGRGGLRRLEEGFWGG